MKRKTVQCTIIKKILFVLATFTLVLTFSFLISNKNKQKTVAYAPEVFVTEWQTNIKDATDSTVSLYFELSGETGYYLIDWDCNGSMDEMVDESRKVTHDYTTPGKYDVCVSALFPISFQSTNLSVDERSKLLKIKQWGTIPWSSFASSFWGMSNMQLTASDAPNLSGVTDMSGAFGGLQNFTGNDSMNSWNTINVTNMKSMFENSGKFNADISDWDTDNVTDMSRMFRNAQSFNQDIGGWNTGNVTNMNCMFYVARAFNQNIENWDTKNVEDMSYMFGSTNAFNQPIGKWTTSKVNNMRYMFYGAAAFNQDIKNWQTGSVTNMSGMFSGATNFDQPIGDWDVSQVIYMTAMFSLATSFNQDISTWQTNRLRDMASMFRGASSFNKPLNSWNTSQVYTMSKLFEGAVAFNQPLDNWITSEVTVMSDMFKGATSFNQPIGNWNTSKVNNMSSLFNNAKAFNQDISTWNVRGVNNFTLFLSDSGLVSDNYDRLLNSWSEQNVKLGLTFGADGVYYCNAETARSNLRTTYSWTINDAGKNCPPSDIDLDNKEINENTTEVGTITATDEETSSIIFTLVPGEGSEDNTKFALNPETGLLAFLTPPDFEDPQGSADPTDGNKYTIRVRATDIVKQYSEAVFVITVNDIDDVGPVITIFPVTKTKKGDITDTEFEVSDRFSIASVGIHASSVASIDTESINCWAKANTLSEDFPYRSKTPDPTNHLTIRCSVTITTSGTLVLYATDLAGYTSTAAEPGYVIDTNGPTFTVANVDISQSGSIHNPTVKFKAEDPTGIQKYQITYGEEEPKTTIDVPEDLYDLDIISYPLNLDSSTPYHTIEIKAYDNAGETIATSNSTSRRIAFPPVIEINAPDIISKDPIDTTTVKITASNPDYKITSIDISGAAASGASLTRCSEPPYTGSVTCEILGIQNTGMLMVEATETDNDTWTHDGSNVQKYFHDIEPPSIVISAPIKRSNSNITGIEITATDEVDLFADGITVHSDTTVGYEPILCDTDDNNKSIVNCTLTITSADIDTDTDKLVIQAKDKAGNTATQTVDGFFIDKTPPDVSIDPPAKVNLNNHMSYTLSGGCTSGDNDPIVIMITQPYLATCNENRWTLPLDLSTYPDGNIPVAVKQTDSVGNQGYAEATLQKDIAPPNVSVNQLPTQKDPTNEDSIKYLIIFSEPIDEATFTNNKVLLLGSSTAKVKSITKVNDTRYEVEVYNLTNGDTVIARMPAGSITDLAGNDNLICTFTDNSVTYDTTPPSVTINQAKDQPDPTNTEPIKFTAVFSEPVNVTDYYKGELEILGSSTAKVSRIVKVNNTTYTVYITGMLSGETVLLTLPAGRIGDMAGNLNKAATYTDNSITYIKEETIVLPPDPLSITIPKPKRRNPFARYINPLIEIEQEGDEEEDTNTSTSPTQTRNLRVKVYDQSKKPIKGVTVEIHSKVRKEITDKNGEAYFENVEVGQHTMIVSYKGQRDERTIDLTNNNEEEAEIEINVQLEEVRKTNYWWIVLIVLLALLWGYKIYKEKK
ncbi:MAG: BspA family leucine-rich repeat surface protein [Candidatus Dojkabacteria bacterium]|jgi:surface protein